MIFEKDIYVLSYGGGINSSALFFYLIENKYPLDIVIFSDTGQERPETYKSVIDLKEICRSKNIKFKIVKSVLGNLYDYYFITKKIPSIMKRDCTDKFKIRPIRKYLRSEYGKRTRFFMYIGISYEEMLRVKSSNVKYIINVFPFVNNKIDRNENIKILERNDFKAFKSGCLGCIFNKKSAWIEMLNNDPELFKKYMLLEENNLRYPVLKLSNSYTLRSLIKDKNKAIDQKIEIDCKTAGTCFL